MSLAFVSDVLDGREPDLLLDREGSGDCARELSTLANLEVYPRSLASARRSLFFLGTLRTDKYLCIISDHGVPGFHGTPTNRVIDGRAICVQVCPTQPENALALRNALPFTAPRVVRLKKSVGLGDRLGLATPGHVRAVRSHDLVPVFAQQSMREMERTGRTARQVIDDACWGVFQEGWRQGFGADADHLKTLEDIDCCVDAGFTFYTIDPSAYVDDMADRQPGAVLEAKMEALPWDALDASPSELDRLYLGKRFLLERLFLEVNKIDLVRAAVKYGRALAHTAQLYRHVASRMGQSPFDLEISVDETDSPTSVVEHFFVASELKRLGVEWTSLAPRFTGRFEKGVDYIGDIPSFEASFAQHAAVARVLGPYKLSLHSGSDKFSVYPIVSRHAADLVHLKTAGTSYLEALRVIAEKDPELFRQIFAFAVASYPRDRLSYHVSADPTRATDPGMIEDKDLAQVLDQFDSRQILHVTYGSVLTSRLADGTTRFRDRLLESLRSNEEDYYNALETHMHLHIKPFE